MCSFPVLLGFIIPALQLLYWTLFEAELDLSFLTLAWNSFYLALSAAALALGLALLLAYSKRLYGRFASIAKIMTEDGLGVSFGVTGVGELLLAFLSLLRFRRNLQSAPSFMFQCAFERDTISKRYRDEDKDQIKYTSRRI